MVIKILPSMTNSRAAISTSIELCLFAFTRSQMSVLLLESSDGALALPSGGVRTDLDQDLAAAAQRVAFDTLGTVLERGTVQTVIGGRHRDLRLPWSMAVIYRSEVLQSAVTLPQGRWLTLSEVRERELPYGQADAIAQGAFILRNNVEAFQFPFGLLPKHFRMRELIHLAEVVLGRRIEQSRFRIQVEERELLVTVPWVSGEGVGRPATLYASRANAPQVPKPLGTRVRKTGTQATSARKPASSSDTALKEEGRKPRISQSDDAKTAALKAKNS